MTSRQKQAVIEKAEEQKIVKMNLMRDPNIILAAKTLNRMDQETFQCNICLGNLIQPMSLQCSHIFCKLCIETHIRTVTAENYLDSCKRTINCPNCGAGPFTKRSLTPAKELSELSNLFQELLDELENAGRIFESL